MVWCLIKRCVLFMVQYLVKHRDNFTFTIMLKKYMKLLIAVYLIYQYAIFQELALLSSCGWLSLY